MQALLQFLSRVQAPRIKQKEVSRSNEIHLKALKVMDLFREAPDSCSSPLAEPRVRLGSAPLRTRAAKAWKGSPRRPVKSRVRAPLLKFTAAVDFERIFSPSWMLIRRREAGMYSRLLDLACDV